MQRCDLLSTKNHNTLWSMMQMQVGSQPLYTCIFFLESCIVFRIHTVRQWIFFFFFSLENVRRQRITQGNPNNNNLTFALLYWIDWWYVQEWSYLRGGLTTVDRDYGWINNIHHDIGTHVIHHLFPQIPHYHLIEAVSSSLCSACGVLVIKLCYVMFIST